MKVMIVEDDEAMAKAIGRALHGAGIIADITASGDDALWMVHATSYDAIVLDVMLPDIEGFAVCRMLRDDGVTVPIIMVTARDAVADRIGGLDAGADDYLTKPFSLAELLARLRALTRRPPLPATELTEIGDLRLDPASRRAWRGDDEIMLSAKEFALLETFMRRPGTRAQPAAAVRRRLGRRLRAPLERCRGVRALPAREDRSPIRGHLDRNGAWGRLPDATRRRAARAMTRSWPIRVRLTVAFAAATTLLLIVAGLFVYQRLYADLDEAVDTTLRARLDAATRLYEATGGLDEYPLEEASEDFVQIINLDGEVIASAGGITQPALDADLLHKAPHGTITLDRRFSSMDGTIRVLAEPSGNGSGVIVAVGRSLLDRDDALRDLRISFLLGGPIAVAVASAVGYSLARRGFAPVEQIRRTADRLSLTGDGSRLPVPDRRDEIQRLALTLNAMLERIELAFENERRFVADASHELRTPIAVVKTELEAALSLPDDPELLLESLRSAIDECDRLAQLADDLLIVARLADGQLPLACQHIDVSKLLGDARLRFVDRATRHDRSIHVDVDGDQTVFVDPTRIRQVLSNLIDNSLRHGAEDITLRARRHADTSRVSIDVIDQGGGFADSIAATAFERFTRGDQARTRTTGAGLGLSIVRSLVHAHHGTVTILPNQPTTVRLELS